MLFFDEGQLMIDDDGYLVGAPELVVEISASTLSVDTNEKYKAYEKHCVKEYLLWDTKSNCVTWYVRNRTKFVAMKPTRAGMLKSKTFPGLWLDVAAMLNGDLNLVMQILNEGLASAPHGQYVKRFKNG